MQRSFTAALLLCSSLAVSACAVDPDRLPRTYLEQAQQAVQAHDAPRALAALDRAQTLWTSGNSPFTIPFGFNPEALRDMGRAREAVQTGRWGDADYWIRTAITQPTVVTPG